MRAVRSKAPASIRSTAIRLLARREYARAELAMRLRERGANPDDVEQTLDELVRLGYLSDERYARMLVTQRAGRYGKRAIAQTLAQRGVAADAAREALDEIPAGDELAQATALWQRRFAQAPADDRERAKQVRFLTSRGYGLSIALKVVRRFSEARRRPTEESTGES
jgi:regulatory protein